VKWTSLWLWLSDVKFPQHTAHHHYWSRFSYRVIQNIKAGALFFETHCRYKRKHSTQTVCVTKSWCRWHQWTRKPKLHWLVTSRHDTTRSTCLAHRNERVKLCSLTSWTQPKCMGATRRTCRVVSRRDVTSQVELYYTMPLSNYSLTGLYSNCRTRSWTSFTAYLIFVLSSRSRGITAVIPRCTLPCRSR